jgi:hypothetical protein
MVKQSAKIKKRKHFVLTYIPLKGAFASDTDIGAKAFNLDVLAQAGAFGCSCNIIGNSMQESGFQV